MVRPEIDIYRTPQGFVDQPFVYVFDADLLTDGSTRLNQAVLVQGGYDFITRRVTGLDSVLNPNSQTAKYRMRNKDGANLTNNPMAVGSVAGSAAAGADFLVIPELFYPETSQIAFDLYNVLRRSKTGPNGEVVLKTQLAFQGVRRYPGCPKQPDYKYKPKPFTYSFPITINWAFNSSGQLTRSFFLNVNNYDFELYTIAVVSKAHASLTTGGPG